MVIARVGVKIKFSVYVGVGVVFAIVGVGAKSSMLHT